MAPVSERGEGKQMTREDCLCPVCLEIFLEPVTLPCLHTFCKSVDKATLCCPLCRKRVSTWARLHSRKQTLVNQELWRDVQTAFPLQCQRRLSGEEVEEEQAEASRPRVCQPGELRKEYEDQLSRLEEERRVGEEEERRASEEFIQFLLQEEEQRLAQERRRQEEKLEEDERLAHLLNQELNSSPVSESASPHARKKPTAGQIDRFLCPLPPKPSPDSNKENILLTSPLPDHTGTAAPSGDPDHTRPAPPGDPDHTRPAPPGDPDHTRPAPPGDPDHTRPVSPGDPDHTRPSPVLTLSSKRKSYNVETGPDSSSKRHCSHPSTWPHQQVSTGCGVGVGEEEEEEVHVLLVEELSRQEEVLFSRHQQEEQDRLVALLLQKELNKEERRASTDRSKGSGDPYQLRRNARPPRGLGTQRPSNTSSSSCSSSSQNEAGVEQKASPDRQSGCSPDSGPALSLPRANKQASLKEMFRRLSS